MRKYCMAFVMVFSLLSSCSQLTEPPLKKCQQRACVKTCFQHYKQCIKACDDSCDLCQRAADLRAKRHYDDFKHQQCVRGGVISRELQSYRDQLQCRKATCNCSADYQVCQQSCEGKIHKRLKIPAGCC